MTQDDIEDGRSICVVRVAPMKPAEFVMFRIGQERSSGELTRGIKPPGDDRSVMDDRQALAVGLIDDRGRWCTFVPLSESIC